MISLDHGGMRRTLLQFANARPLRVPKPYPHVTNLYGPVARGYYALVAREFAMHVTYEARDHA
jgi:hypothetical protein